MVLSLTIFAIWAGISVVAGLFLGRGIAIADDEKRHSTSTSIPAATESVEV